MTAILMNAEGRLRSVQTGSLRTGTGLQNISC